MPFSNNSFVLYNDKQDELIYVIWIKENKDNKYFFKNLGHMKKLNIKDVGERIVFTTYPNINTTFFLSHTEFMKDKNNIKEAGSKIIDIFKKYNHFHINRIFDSLSNTHSGGSGNTPDYKRATEVLVSYHLKHKEELQGRINQLAQKAARMREYVIDWNQLNGDMKKMMGQDDFDYFMTNMNLHEKDARKIQNHIVNEIFPDLNKHQQQGVIPGKIMISFMKFYSEQSEEVKKILLSFYDFKNFFSEFNANRIKRNKKNKNRKKRKKKNKKNQEEAPRKISQFLQSRFRGIKSRERTNDLAPFPSGTPNFDTVLAQTKKEFPQLKGGRKKYSLKNKRKHRYTKAKRKRFRKSKKKKRRKIKTRKNK